MKKTFYFTSESVTEGHPDKICDLICDSILDDILRNDKEARVACEAMVTSNLVFLAGELKTKFNINAEKITRNAIESIGYNDSNLGFDYKNCVVLSSFKHQSDDISRGIEKNDYLKTGAGDQGVMFGFACKDTKQLMPLPITLAHQLSKRLSYVRKNNILKYLKPDGKTQVTVEYENNLPKKIKTILISAQHDKNIDQDILKQDIIKRVILETGTKEFMDDGTKILINPTGRFVLGGPAADTGLAGRKIILDTYGGFARHGGGAFSGKDPTKVDRSAAYMSRYVAKNIVKNNLADKCEIGVAYAIGLSDPLAIFLDTFNTNKISEDKILKFIKENFDFRPGAIIERFNLNSPIYSELTNYGMAIDVCEIQKEKNQ
ncbi:MAG: methionine adenosyltransferase [Clostridiales bacterium]|jgi:S-adenosylmethionine synthetase|nr:methionine adenosyltransferase [Clostridiales bacterium]